MKNLFETEIQDNATHGRRSAKTTPLGNDVVYYLRTPQLSDNRRN
jgi:hypothetical protein